MVRLARRHVGALLTLALLVAVTGSVLAVRFGEPDNGRHPYVGLIVFFDAQGEPQWRCTGTLISPRVMLTAGHCTELNAGARVYFDEQVRPASGYPTAGGVVGQAHTFPEWTGALAIPNTGDAGVVVLAEPVTRSQYGALAPVGYLDDLATARGQKDVDFKVVGYGLQAVKPRVSAVPDRLVGFTKLVNLRSALTDGYNVHTTNAPGNGTGGSGTCFGDSGGAIFAGDSNVIVAVNSFVLNANCAGASFGYRVERKAVQDWVNGFLR